MINKAERKRNCKNENINQLPFPELNFRLIIFREPLQHKTIRFNALILI